MAYHASKYAVEALSDALRFEVAGFGVGVTLIQPGLIRTEFAATAGAAARSNEHDDGGEAAYSDFNRAVASATHDAYSRGPSARLTGEPDDVAKAIEKAVTARRAPLRVRVAASAHLLVAQRRMMTDRMWDRFVATQFPRPGGSR